MSTPLSSKVLVVDDEVHIVELARLYLTREGYEVEGVGDGAQAMARFSQLKPDLVILDIMLPGSDGLTICKEIRKLSQVPIIMLTARDDEFDKVLGLELGADDYITKPFSIREFRSRVKAALRRSSMGVPASAGERDEAEEPVDAGELRIDFDKRTVRVREELVRTTFVEFEIIGLLARSPGRVFTREALLERIWGDSAYRDPRTIDVHIRHLREKLERDAKEPEYIFTVRGVGYRFRDRDAER
jgi:DNA-binding response OmpR family regulator